VLGGLMPFTTTTANPTYVALFFLEQADTFVQVQTST
jgi:hypothetical protein